ncbi:gamma-interferon-inducible protein 16-like isoform X2 [Centroberyx affinis]
MERKISEAAWMKALTSIIEELDKRQYKKMLNSLDKIPNGVKKGNNSKEEMPQIIIQHFGVEESISAMKKVLYEIPRRDDVVQELLRPFVDKLRNKQQKQKDKGKKRKFSDSESETEEPEKPSRFSRDINTERWRGQKRKYVSESESEDEEREPVDQQKKSQSDKENTRPSRGNFKSWRKTIYDLKESLYLGNKAIVGKVIRKSGLRPYETQNKEKKVMFYLGLADETDSIKAVVYGKNRYEEIKEGSYYLFREVIIGDNTVKVTKLSTVSKTTAVQVPAELKMEARMIVDPQKPVLSIKEAKASYDKTEMSVEGIITKLTPVSKIKVKGGRRRTALQRDLILQDDTGSIRICLWRDQADQCTAEVGDSVRVTNVKTDHYMETVSLNSTGLTRVYKVQAAAVQTETVEIIGIIKASKKETWLEAELDQELKTLVVESKLLAKTFGIRLEGDFEERLLDKMPFSAEAEIQGNKITAITKM